MSSGHPPRIVDIDEEPVVCPHCGDNLYLSTGLHDFEEEDTKCTLIVALKRIGKLYATMIVIGKAVDKHEREGAHLSQRDLELYREIRGALEEAMER